MNSRFGFFALVTLAVAALLVACAGQPNAAPNGAAVNTGNTGAVPGPLHTMEEGAEDIIDRAPNGGWDKIATQVAAMNEAWKEYQPQAAAAGASQTVQDALSAALKSLQTAATANDAAGTMQAANDASAAVIEMYALYNPTVPADIGQLDVLERQVVLDVAANDFTAASASLNKTKEVWAKIKPSVLSHNGQDAAAQFEASLATQETALQAKDAQNLTSEAKNGLELVDVLEKVYES